MVIGAVVLVTLLVIIGQLWYLQVLEGGRFLDASDKNRIRIRPVAAPRGILFDRNLSPLVDNRPAFTLSLIPRELPRDDVARGVVLGRVAALLQIPYAELAESLGRVAPDSLLPVRVRRGLSLEDMAKVEEWKLELPGVAKWRWLSVRWTRPNRVCGLPKAAGAGCRCSDGRSQRRAQPSGFRNGILFVTVATQSWMQELQYMKVVSPVDGYVVRVYGEKGTIAGPTSPTLLLAARQDLHIEAEVSSEDAAKLKVGMPLEVTSPAYPGVIFAARLDRVSEIGELKPDAAIRTRIVRARVILDEGWARFRPGVEVDVEGSQVLKQALAVPSDAISLEDSRTVVFVVQNGTARAREVRVGVTTMAATEVLSGLQQGERVVVDGKTGLTDGARVRERP